MKSETLQLRTLPILQANGPYDFQRSFSRIVCAVVATRHPEMGSRSQLLDDREFALPLRLHGRPLLVGIRAVSGNGVAPRVVAGGDHVDREALLAEIRRILCLDHDLSGFYRTVQGDRPLEHLAQRYRGLRLTLTPTVFQGLVHAILFQQISYTAAQTVENRLITRWGEELFLGDRRFFLFPTPQTPAAQSMDALRSIGIPPRKAQAILEVARQNASGKLDLEGMAPLAELRDLLPLEHLLGMSASLKQPRQIAAEGGRGIYLRTTQIRTTGYSCRRVSHLPPWPASPGAQVTANQASLAKRLLACC